MNFVRPRLPRDPKSSRLPRRARAGLRPHGAGARRTRNGATFCSRRVSEQRPRSVRCANLWRGSTGAGRPDFPCTRVAVTAQPPIGITCRGPPALAGGAMVVHHPAFGFKTRIDPGREWTGEALERKATAMAPGLLQKPPALAGARGQPARSWTQFWRPLRSVAAPFTENRNGPCSAGHSRRTDRLWKRPLASYLHT
jgi:hypothetical protein